MAHGHLSPAPSRNPFGQNLQSSRLSVEDIDQIAFGLRMKGIRGDVNAGLVADALESVARRRHAARMMRSRRHSPGLMSSAWQRVTAWASLR
jgi:hypothetical protein